MSQPVFHRLHPGTILLSVVQAVRRLLLAVVYFAFSCVQGAQNDGGASTAEMIGAGLGLFIGVGAVIRYFIYGYAITQDSLIIRDGWLTKTTRTIPLDRIQNINFKRGLLHRILGVVDVEIETAGGAKAEASLSALSEDNARRLKVLLTGESHLAMSPIMSARQDPLVYAASTKELFLAGATQNRAFAILFAVLGIFGVGSQAFFERTAKSAIRSNGAMFQNLDWWRTGALALVALMLVGWIVSIVMSFVTYWGFELRQQSGKLKRTYGLLNHVENVIQIRRIQVVRMSETMIQRWMNLCSMHVDTAGSIAAAASSNDGQQSAAGLNANLISPLMESARAPELLQVALPGIRLDSPDWKPISPKSIARKVRVGLLVNLIWAPILATATQAFRIADNDFSWQDWGIAAGGIYVALMLLTWLTALLYYRTARWWDQGDVFVSRTGVLSRNTWYAPIAKIQSIQIAQTPGQRRLDLASVTFRTAAMHGTAAVEVNDVDASLAEALAHDLHERSAIHAWANPDGF